ncbi:GNAT family N-acetyltransferase [Streptomyces tibetensis]|uniref:GNAT family N-acetyltransferase n=1 Tax=Streptomyces tibetensis TaxID=2382123 RepID=UPI0033E6714F
MQKPKSSSATQVLIKLVGARDELVLAAIVELGDRFNKTLGFMPPAAYVQAAEENRLLAAMAGRKLVGYTLFSLPRQQIRLTHLCVDPDSRGQGIARLLVDEISARHHDRSGIVLKCRKDYGYDAMWRQLGFEARNEVDGRGKDRKPLVVWSRDHDHPHLFSDLESTALLTVAMDCNVFADLHSSGERHGAEESRTLTSDWLAGLVDLAVLPQLKAEIGKITNAAERRRQLQATHGYAEPSVSRSEADRLFAELRSAVQIHIGDRRQLSENDLRDLRYVAESSASGILFLVTRDGFLASLSDIAMSVCQVRILRPSDIVLHVDELTRAQVYQPGDLLGTSLTVRAVPAGQEQGQLAFLNKAGGERRNDFVAELRRLAAHPARWVRQQVIDAEGTVAAIYGYGVRDGQLVVPLLRALDGHPMHQTLARQILFRLRDHCRRSGVRLLSLTDRRLQPSVRIAAREDGFREHDGTLVTLVLDVCADARTVDEQAQSAAALVGLQIPAVPAAMPAAAAAALERAWWPAKITDSQTSRSRRLDSLRFRTGSHPAPIAAHQHDHCGRHDGHDRNRGHHQVAHGHPVFAPDRSSRPALRPHRRRLPGNRTHSALDADRSLLGSSSPLTLPPSSNFSARWPNAESARTASAGESPTSIERRVPALGRPMHQGVGGPGRDAGGAEIVVSPQARGPVR